MITQIAYQKITNIHNTIKKKYYFGNPYALQHFINYECEIRKLKVNEALIVISVYSMVR